MVLISNITSAWLVVVQPDNKELKINNLDFNLENTQ